MSYPPSIEAGKLKWQEAPNKIEFGAKIMEALVELSRDETAYIYAHAKAVPLVESALRAVAVKGSGYPPPTEARVVLIDGPVAVFIHEAGEWEILEAFRRLERLVEVAAKQLGEAAGKDAP